MDFKQAFRNKRTVKAGQLQVGNGGRTNLSSLMDSILKQDKNCSIFQKRNMKKIFSSFMLNAWRKRRLEVALLTEKINALKQISQEPVHFYSPHKPREDRRMTEFKSTMKELLTSRIHCKKLTASLARALAEKTAAEAKLQRKDEECVGLCTILEQTKGELFRTMSMQLNLLGSMAVEQRRVQVLENQKKDLLEEISDFKTTSKQVEQHLMDTANIKSFEIERSKAFNDEMFIRMKIQEVKVQGYTSREKKLKNEVETLQSEIVKLKQVLESSSGDFWKTCLNASLVFPCAAMQVLHWVAHCLLPAVPRPKTAIFPFTVAPMPTAASSAD